MIKIRIIVILLICFSFSLSQTTGKIAGRIVDDDSGEPLNGVNVVAISQDGSEMIGAATDLHGYYFILNIKPATYNVNVTMIGYSNKEIQNVKVSVNRTTKIDVSLKMGVIEGKEVIVVGKEITIKQDQTTSVRNVDAEQLEILPIESIGDAVRMQPGVVMGHFRGGRSSESVTMIDGISLGDGMGGSMISVTDDAAQEVEVITGVFDAKYGHASTGITNIITKEGSNKLHGKIKGSLGNFFTSKDDIYIGITPGEVDRRREMRANLSGPIIKNKVYFTISTKIDNDKGPYNGIHRFNVTDSPDYSHNSWTNPENWTGGTVGEGEYSLGEYSGNEDFVPMDWNSSQNYDAKITYKEKSFKMNVHYIGDRSEGQGYSHGRRYSPNGRSRFHGNSDAMIFTVNHMLSNKLFYDISGAYFDNYSGSYLYKNPIDSRYIPDNYNKGGNDGGFSTGGQDKGHGERSTKKYVGKLDITYQANSHHKFQLGGEINSYDIDYNYHSIRNIYENTEAENYLYSPVILDDSTAHADVYQRQPIKARAYITDKMEYEDMVLSFGFGFEYFDPNASYPSDLRDPNGMIFGETKEIKADPTLNIAPRLGFSYKLGDQALLKFSYGHTYNIPSYHNMYQNNSRVISPTDYASTIGMPNIEPQKNVKYQIGLWQKLSNNLSLELDLWKENHFNYATIKSVTTYNQIKYGYYSNKDYGSARGLEGKMDAKYGNFMATAAYTLQFTKGNADEPMANFRREGSAQSAIADLIPLSWDQRHTFNLFASYKTEKYFVTLKGDFGSGSVYTWTPIDGNPIHKLFIYPNNSYKPYTYTVDMRARYDIIEINNMKIFAELFVDNLLDRLNEYGVNSNTGRANQQIVKDYQLEAHRSDFADYQERVDSPTVYGHPRRIKMTLGFEF